LSTLALSARLFSATRPSQAPSRCPLHVCWPSWDPLKGAHGRHSGLVTAAGTVDCSLTPARGHRLPSQWPSPWPSSDWSEWLSHQCPLAAYGQLQASGKLPSWPVPASLVPALQLPVRRLLASLCPQVLPLLSPSLAHSPILISRSPLARLSSPPIPVSDFPIDSCTLLSHSVAVLLLLPQRLLPLPPQRLVTTAVDRFVVAILRTVRF
jgi:hypothetical protein